MTVSQSHGWLDGLQEAVWLVDETSLLILHANAAAQRLVGARVPDRFESQPVAFFERVAQGYADRAAGAPQRFARIDAAQSIEAVGTDVGRVVADWLNRALP